MKTIEPPRLARRILRWYCADEVLETLEGDLYELYEIRCRRYGKVVANVASFVDVISACRPFAFGKSNQLHITTTDMFRNYVKITVRHLSRQKLYAAINIGGLALGLASFITIMLYVQHEFSYNRSYPDVDKIYRVYQRQDGNTFLGTDYFAVMPAQLATTMLAEFPEVEHATTVVEATGLITHGDDHFYEKGLAGDARFFDVFQLPFLTGSPAKALVDPKSIVLTKTLAKTIFGDRDPVGETLQFLDQEGFHVTAVVEDASSTSSFQYTFIIQISFHDGYVDAMKRAGWNNNSFHTYFTLKDATRAKTVEAKFPALISKYHLPTDYKEYPFKDTFFVESLTDVYFHPNINFDLGLKGDRDMVYIFGVVALVVLLLACVNYMNLAIVRSIKRAKEVGLRKVAGAARRQLVIQFLAESIAIALLSLLVSIALVYLAVPYFGWLMERPVAIDFTTNTWLLPGLFGLMTVVGLISGIYPALVMSSLKPMDVLRVNGDVRLSGVSLQKALIVLQFAASFGLVIASLVIYRQLEFIKNKELGYDRANILTVRLRDFELRKKFVSLSNQWAQNPHIIDATISSHLPANISSSSTIKSRPESATPDLAIYQLSTQYNFLDLYGIKLIAGRNFSRAFNDTTGANYILNETAVRALGWTVEDAIGKDLSRGENQPRTVIGVVKDFHMHSMREPIHPLMIRFSEDRGGYFSIKIDPDKKQQVIEYLEKSIRNASPYPFEYEFFEDHYNRLYSSEARLGEMFVSFTILAVVIASLGLFGLAAFATGQRTREIGIRKVLGAGRAGIVVLVSRDFLRLVTVAVVGAIPLSWYFMHNWLRAFAFRIELEWWFFTVAALFMILVAYISIGYQSLRAASANPVDSLRGE